MASSVNFYADFKSLAALKGDAAAQDPKALREAARQFESLFTQMMLKSMRQASLGKGLMESDQSDFYREMFDSQMATQMSKGKGLGLGDMLVRQLQGAGGKAGADQATKVGTRDSGIGIRQSIESSQSKLIPISNAPTIQHSVVGVNHAPVAAEIPVDFTAPLTAKVSDGGDISIWCGNGVDETPVTDPSDLSRLMVQVARAAAAQDAPTLTLPREAGEEESISISDFSPSTRDSRLTTHDSSPASRVSRPETNSSQDVTLAAHPAEQFAANPSDFVTQLWPHAKAAADELGVDPRMLIAHAALETGWGKSIPCNPDGTCSFNLFGIKASGRWNGPSVGVNTVEFEDGVAVRRQASFRAYESPAESFRDYAALIKNSPRYAAAVGTGNDANAFASALQQGGYATDPNYAAKLASVAQRVRVPFKVDGGVT